MAIPSWLSLSKTQDTDGGTDTITVTATPNTTASGGRTGTSSRSCTLTVKPSVSALQSKSVAVSQAGVAGTLTFKLPEYGAVASGGSINIEYDTLFSLTVYSNAKAILAYGYDGSDVFIFEGMGVSGGDMIPPSTPPTPSVDAGLIQQKHYCVIPGDPGASYAYYAYVDFEFFPNTTEPEGRRVTVFFDYYGDNQVKTFELSLTQTYAGGGKMVTVNNLETLTVNGKKILTVPKE